VLFRVGGREGDFAYDRMGILSGNFELNSSLRPIMAWPRISSPLKETIFKTLNKLNN